MPLSWKRKFPFRKSTDTPQRIEQTASQYYQNRLLQEKPGDAQSDWETAEKIVQNPIRRFLFSLSCFWLKFKPPITRSLLFSIIAVCFTWWLDYQAETRQQTTSQNLNHQRVLESYIANLKEIRLSQDYHNTSNLVEERAFIVGMTLPVLRELTNDEARKAQLVLFLYQMEMCGITIDHTCQKQLVETAEILDRSDLSAPLELSAPLDPVDPTAQSIAEEPSEQPLQPDFLQTADLKFANFRGYKLPDISFRGADLRGANLAFADLREASLISANLSCHQRNVEKWWSWVPFLPQATEQICTTLQTTNLQQANLSGTVLDGAILLRTDLREAQGLTQQQLEGEQPPWLCNVGLPNDFDRQLSNRDCDTLPSELHQRYPREFRTLQKAQTFVEDQKAIDWEAL